MMDISDPLEGDSIRAGGFGHLNPIAVIVSTPVIFRFLTLP